MLIDCSLVDWDLLLKQKNKLANGLSEDDNLWGLVEMLESMLDQAKAGGSQCYITNL